MKPLVAGHRGAAGLAPENTLPSFLKAVELGAPMVELDARLTRDGEVVCFHDDRLERVTPERGLVSEWEWERLSAVPVMPGAFGGAYPDARIPLLRTVLDAVPDECRVLVELKPDAERGDYLVERALETVHRSGTAGRCRIISFDHGLLRLVRALTGGRSPAWRLGGLAGRRDGETAFSRAREVGAEALHVEYRLADEDLLRRAKEEGFLLNAWTVNSPEEVRRLAALGVDEITTDFPDMALEALKHRGGA
jgi:glycerophosphoryl diester phosphodiesterase